MWIYVKLKRRKEGGKGKRRQKEKKRETRHRPKILQRHVMGLEHYNKRTGWTTETISFFLLYLHGGHLRISRNNRPCKKCYLQNQSNRLSIS